MEIMRFYKQKRLVHKYVNWMYDLLADRRFYSLERAKHIHDLPAYWVQGDPRVRYLERMYNCASNLSGIMDPSTGKHYIDHGFFCGDRVCPICAIKKSLKEWSKLRWHMESFGDKYTYYFLTLTLPNNQDGFKEEINLLSDILTQLGEFIGYNRRKDMFSFCDGFYGSFEITKSAAGWHPHVHLVLAYPKEYVISTNTVYKKINGRERTFENGLQLRAGKRSLFLSQDNIMQRFIELVKLRTHKYDEALEALPFLNISFMPCYNVDDVSNEMSKYFIDFEALQSADDLFIYMRDIYKLKQRVRRGIFIWSPDVEQQYIKYLDDYHNQINVLYNTEKCEKFSFRWSGTDYYIAFKYVDKDFPIMFTNKFKKGKVMIRYMIVPLYDSRGKPDRYDIQRLRDLDLPDFYEGIKLASK